MKKEILKQIEALKYSIRRYQSMGNGTMCQSLNSELQKLMSNYALAK